jgi:hypothetical protein
MGTQFHRLVEISANEHDARIDWCRTQRDENLLAGVQTHARSANRVV